MMLLAIFAAGIAFYEVFVGLGALKHVADMMATTNGSLAVVKSTTLSDEEKAAAMQKSSAAMFAAIFLMLAKILAASAAAAIVLFLISLVKWNFEELALYSIKPVPLIAVVIFLALYGKFRHGRRAKG